MIKFFDEETNEVILSYGEILDLLDVVKVKLFEKTNNVYDINLYGKVECLNQIVYLLNLEYKLKDNLWSDSYKEIIKEVQIFYNKFENI